MADFYLEDAADTHSLVGSDPVCDGQVDLQLLQHSITTLQVNDLTHPLYLADPT